MSLSPPGSGSQIWKEAHSNLKDFFGYTSFRSGQETAIGAAFDKKDCLVVMATGSGKSLCYQIPALSSEKGLVLVVSPLISLMHDQITALKTRGIRAISTNEKSAVSSAMSGDLALLYTTPESALGRWKDKWAELHQSVGVKLIAIDEAHCVSEWGHDFRPEYQRLAELRAALPGVPVMALTATATPQVQEEVIRGLRLGGRGGAGAVRVVTTFDRPNLYYEAHERGGALGGSRVLIDVVARCKGAEAKGTRHATIVYALSHKETERVAGMLQDLGMPADQVAFYHAGMSDKERTQVHDAFMQDRLHVVVATTAFGMGIDKADVRHVVHWGAPKTLESYYQQSGRAGRDGEPSTCTVLYSGQDFAMGSFYEQGRDGLISAAGRAALHAGLGQMRQYCHSTACRRDTLLRHFGEQAAGPAAGLCGRCDNCARRQDGAVTERDFGEPARMLLEAVRECGGRFGVLKYVAFLRGAGALPAWCKQKPGFGAGAGRHADWWKCLAQQLLVGPDALLQEFTQVGKGAFGHHQQSYTLVRLSPLGHRFLDDPPAPLRLPVPREMELLERAGRPARGRDPGSQPGPPAPEAFDRLTYAPRPAAAAAAAAAARPSQAGLGKAGRRALEDEEEELLQRLFSVREKLAKRDGVALSLVCQDAVLYELAMLRPSSREGLAEIDGASRAFVERHGDVMVQAVVAFCSQPLVSLQLDGWRETKRQRAAEAADAPPSRQLPAWITASRGGSLRGILPSPTAAPAAEPADGSWTQVHRRPPVRAAAGPEPPAPSLADRGSGPSRCADADPGRSAPAPSHRPAIGAAADGGKSPAARRAGGVEDADGWEGRFEAVAAAASTGAVRSRIAEGAAAVLDAVVGAVEGRLSRGQVLVWVARRLCEGPPERCGAAAGVVSVLARAMELGPAEQDALDRFAAGHTAAEIAAEEGVPLEEVVLQLAAAASIVGPEMPEPLWARLLSETFAPHSGDGGGGGDGDGEGGRVVVAGASEGRSVRAGRRCVAEDEEAEPDSRGGSARPCRAATAPAGGAAAHAHTGAAPSSPAERRSGAVYEVDGDGPEQRSRLSAQPRGKSAKAGRRRLAEDSDEEVVMVAEVAEEQQRVDVIDVEEVSAEEMALLEDAISTAEALASSSRSASQPPSHSQEACADPLHDDPDGDGGRIAAVEAEARPALGKEAVLRFIVEHRGSGVALDAVAAHFGAASAEEVAAVELVVVQLEEDADVYREGRDMLFPI